MNSNTINIKIYIVLTVCQEQCSLFYMDYLISSSQLYEGGNISIFV